MWLPDSPLIIAQSGKKKILTYYWIVPTMEDSAACEAVHLLRTIFGHQDFKSDLQRKAVEAVLEGNFDWDEIQTFTESEFDTFVLFQMIKLLMPP